MVLERLSSSVRTCTFLFIPNAHQPSRHILAFSGLINEDNDYYFDDSVGEAFYLAGELSGVYVTTTLHW